MGFFVADDTPVIWRGPMLHKALEQFLVDAYWGEPDFLLIDMPPGTGDVTLSLGQYLHQDRGLRGHHAATGGPAGGPALGLRRPQARSSSVRGVIENMSWFTGDDGTRYELFGAGGGAPPGRRARRAAARAGPARAGAARGRGRGRARWWWPSRTARWPRCSPAGRRRSPSLGPARVYRQRAHRPLSRPSPVGSAPPDRGSAACRSPPSGIGDDAEHLVDGEAAVVEPVGRRRHVEPPDVGPGSADQRDRLVPAALRGWPPSGGGSASSARGAIRRRAPRSRSAAWRRTTSADVEELAVGEHVAPDEGAPPERRAARLRDGVVEETPGRARADARRVSKYCVIRDVPDVLEHPDRGDRVEGLAAEVAVVLQPDLDPVGETRLLDPPSGQVDLLAAERHADHLRPVVACGVDGHRAPSAADVEEPCARSLVEAELAADQLVLGRLGLFEGARRRRRSARRSRSCVWPSTSR